MTPKANPPRPGGANRSSCGLKSNVDRRRARGGPVLLRRVRWGNVGRLVALLAAGALIATGGRGCGPEPEASFPANETRKVDRAPVPVKRRPRKPAGAPKREQSGHAAGRRGRKVRRAAGRRRRAPRRRAQRQGKGDQTKSVPVAATPAVDPPPPVASAPPPAPPTAPPPPTDHSGSPTPPAEVDEAAPSSGSPPIRGEFTPDPAP